MQPIEQDDAITITGLRKTFNGLTAVDGIDLQVRRGEIFGLVGPDGAGKTTTMRLLAGLLDPDAGGARVAGFDVQRQTEAMKRQIGYMPQRFSLYGDLTVAENMRFFATIYQVPRAERLARQQRLLEFSRLEPFLKRQAQFLSGGMKQKLALACVLMHTPQVLFLDEPTTGVDPVSRRDFWKILYSLLQEGVTLFVSTPYMDEAERCTRVALMNRGRIIFCGTPARGEAADARRNARSARRAVARGENRACRLARRAGCAGLRRSPARAGHRCRGRHPRYQGGAPGGRNDAERHPPGGREPGRCFRVPIGRASVPASRIAFRS